MATPSPRDVRPDPEAAALKVPPHSIEAEQSVLGGLMLDNAAWDQVADLVSEGDFYRYAHRLIFRAIGALAEQSSPFDVVTLSSWLKDRGELEPAGGLAYLGELAANTPSAANIKAYATLVRERSVLRDLIRVAGEVADSAFQPEGRDTAALLDNAERLVFEIAERGLRRRAGFRPMKDLLVKVVDRIDALYQRDNPITGVSTGFSDLDGLTSGLQASDLIIVAGRPSMGKTSFAMNLAEHALLGDKLPVAIFSMEMPGEQLVMRLLSSLGRIDQHKVRTGKLDADDWPRLTSAIGMLSDRPMFIDDTPALTPTELRARARRLKREHGLGLVVIDYLQLMQVPGTKENRATEISEISRSLKALAKEIAVPIVALSQLNRSLEQRPNKRPVMSDLRECVTGETLVCLADGRRVPVRELVGQVPRVWSLDADQRVIEAEANQVWSVGVRPVFRVALASGRTLRATAEHRLLRADGWRTVSELRPGDRLAVATLESQAQSVGSSGPERAPVADWPAGQSASDLYWDRVVGVEPDGAEEVFDLTVPGPACWLADGVVSHNSGAIEQDADLIMFIYRDEVYNEESPDKGTAEIIVAKQRNGPIGTVRLTFLGKYTRFENFSPETMGAGAYL